MRISLRPAEPGRSSLRLLSREWWMRSASGRPSSGPGLEQHANGLADEDRAGPVAVPQVMQPRAYLRRHDQGIAHAGRLLSTPILRTHNIPALRGPPASPMPLLLTAAGVREAESDVVGAR